jgi:hypothetical protein
MTIVTVRSWADPIFAWVRECVCLTEAAQVGSPPCAASAATASAPALWTFAFGVWMLVLGLSFIVVPTLDRGPASGFSRIAKAIGFPGVAGVWSRLFGLSVAALSLLYFVAAAFELRTFFWMSVFGRLGIFATCTLLSWNHGRKAKAKAVARPHALLWAATPDLLSATATAWVLLPDSISRVVFVGGVALLTTALGFLTFPAWIIQLVGLNVEPDTWNTVLAALLFFFGAYDLAAAILGLTPILVAAILGNTAVMLGVVIALFCEPAARRSNWRLKTIATALFIAMSLALFGSLGGNRAGKTRDRGATRATTAVSAAPKWTSDS